MLLFLLIIQRGIFAQAEVKYELTEIKFSGNNSISSIQLLESIKSKETPFWVWKFLKSFTPLGSSPVYFDSTNIPIDLSALTAAYSAIGFFNTEITSSYEVNDDEVKLKFNIVENDFSYFGKIKLDGFTFVDSIDLDYIKEDILSIDSSKRYTEAEVEQNISAIELYLTNNGYINERYDSTVVFVDNKTKRADVYLFFTCGSKYRIGEIKVITSGESKKEVSDQVIEELSGLEKGEIVDHSKMIAGESTLLRTEMFKSLFITPIIKDTSSYLIPIEISGVVGALNDVSPEINLNNQYGSFNVDVGAGYTRKNFLGKAGKLNTGVSFTFIDLSNFALTNLFKPTSKRDSTFQGIFNLTLKMEQPYLFGKHANASTEFYFRRQIFTSFTEKSFGGNQTFAFDFTKIKGLSISPIFTVDLSEREIRYGTYSNTGKDTSYLLYLGVNSLALGTTVKINYSTIDNILFPTRGLNFYFIPEVFHSSTKVTLTLLPISGIQKPIEEWARGGAFFYRIQTGISNFISLNKINTWVLGTKLNLGYLQAISPSNDNSVGSLQLVPPNKTFYSGGSNSVRGWKSRSLVPSDGVEYIGISSGSDEIRGGTFLIEGSIEFRRVMSNYFGFTIFGDFGNTWNGYKKVQINDFAISVGIGLRVFTPFVPFRFDFGTRFYDPMEEKWIFKKNFLKNIRISFGIGEAF